MTEQTPDQAATQAPKRPGEAWMKKMRTEEPQAREQWPAGTVYEPHVGRISDANLHYTDLLSGPDEDHPDPAATPPRSTQ